MEPEQQKNPKPPLQNPSTQSKNNQPKPTNTSDNSSKQSTKLSFDEWLSNKKIGRASKKMFMSKPFQTLTPDEQTAFHKQCIAVLSEFKEFRQPKQIQNQQINTKNGPAVQLNFPFLLKPQKLISFNTQLKTKAYLCRFSGQFLAENIMTQLVHFINRPHDQFTKKTRDLTSEVLETVFATEFKEQFMKEQLNKTQLMDDSIPQFKCTMMTMDQTNTFLLPEIVDKYLSKLRAFYHYKNYLITKHLFCSEQTLKTNQQLQLMYFKFVSKNEINEELLLKIAQTFSSEKGRQKQASEKKAVQFERNQLQYDSVMINIIGKMKSEQFYHKNIAYKILSEQFQDKTDLITPIVLIQLLQILKINRSQICQRVLSLIYSAIFLKPQLVQKPYPQKIQDKGLNSKRYFQLITENTKKQKQKTLETSSQTKAQQQKSSASVPQNKSQAINNSVDDQPDESRFSLSQTDPNSKASHTESNQTEKSGQFNDSNSAKNAPTTHKTNQIHQKSQENNPDPLQHKKTPEITPEKAQNNMQKPETESQPIKTSQNKDSKNKYLEQTLMITYILDVGMQTELNTQTILQQILLDCFKLNQQLLTPKIIKSLILYQILLEAILKKEVKDQKQRQQKDKKQKKSWILLIKNLLLIQNIAIDSQIDQLIDKQQIDCFNVVQAFLNQLEPKIKSQKVSQNYPQNQTQVSGEHSVNSSAQISKNNILTESNQVKSQEGTKKSSSQKDQIGTKKIIEFAQLKRLFVTHQIHNVMFARTQKQQLNFKLEEYAQNCKRLYAENKTKQKNVSAQNNLKTHVSLFVFSEYYPGKKLKDLIQSNWTGLQNPSIALKLIQKLFYLQLQLEYHGFDMHIPTLENTIVHDSLTHPDLNINMTQFIGTSFLFTPFKQQSGSQKKVTIQHSAVQDILPFVWSDEFQTVKRQAQPKIMTYKINQIKHILSISLFIICQRLGSFESFETICSKLKPLVDQKKKKKEENIKEKGKEAKENPKEILETETKSLQKGNEGQGNSLEDKALSILAGTAEKQQIFQKHHFQSLVQFVPNLYDAYLSEEKDVRRKKYQQITYKNSNFYRIKQFEEYLLEGNELQHGFLFQMFRNALVGDDQSKKPVTWRKLYQTFFIKLSKQSSPFQENDPFAIWNEQIKNSRLLKYLCQFFDYPLENQKMGTKLPPELYFALRYDINFTYFASKFKSGWFKCFELSSKEEVVQYDIEVMCLLKNIKLEITQKLYCLVPQLNKSSSNQPVSSGLHPIDPNEAENCKKIRSGLQLLDYLREYEKRVYQQGLKDRDTQKVMLFEKESKTEENEGLKDQNASECEFYEQEYSGLARGDKLLSLCIRKVEYKE